MTFCEKCGAQLSTNAAFCASCGASVSKPATQPTQTMTTQDATTTIPQTRPQGRPTRAWYLVPILLNILGGIIGYFAVRNEDRQFANRLLILGIVMFVLAIVGYALLIASSLYLLSSI